MPSAFSSPRTVRSGSSLWLARVFGPAPEPGAVRIDRRFFVLHAWVPLAAFVLLVLVSMGVNGDRWLADRIYAWEGHQWLLRDAFLTDTLAHEGGRDASTLAWLGVLAAWIVASLRERWAHLRRPLAYLCVTTALAAGLVAWFKSWSNMDCPWDLLRYGGGRPYVGLFGMRPVGLSRGACFPAGHASSGYAWLSLYFFLWIVKPRLRWVGLWVALALGLVFGVAQQLRGAHFLSHDVWTAGICWAVAVCMYVAFWHRGGPDAPRSPDGMTWMVLR